MSEEILLKLVDYANLQNKLIESNCEKIIFQKENLQLKQRINKAIEYTKGLREKYFKMCVAGSNNDLSELIEILKEDL